MLATLFVGAHCLADDVVTFEEFEVNNDGYQNDFGDDACFEAGGTIGRDSPSPVAQTLPSNLMKLTNSIAALVLE